MGEFPAERSGVPTADSFTFTAETAEGRATMKDNEFCQLSFKKTACIKSEWGKAHKDSI